MDGKVEIQNSTLLPLIAAAYNVEEPSVFGRQWSAEPRYNITATSTFGPGPQASTALQSLLISRFGVVVKHQLRQMNGYVLMVGSGGPKIRAAVMAPGTARFMRVIPSGTLLQPQSPPSGYQVSNMPMSALVKGFSMSLHAPVIDETGLQGDYAYSYEVSWQPGAAPDPATLSRSLEEQLGLHLEARPLNVDTIEVVSVKPAQEVVAQR
jgi:uncharacterized protein (TIGR03435 family)